MTAVFAASAFSTFVRNSLLLFCIAPTAYALRSFYSPSLEKNAPIIQPSLEKGGDVDYSDGRTENPQQIREQECMRKIYPYMQMTCFELEKDPTAMTQAAIRLVMCDISSARLQPPMECNSLSTDDQIHDCLHAIERSSQFWTSYTLHRQSITTDCYAYKRLHDEDEARQLYRKMALEKTELLQFVRSDLAALLLQLQKRCTELDDATQSSTELHGAFLEMIHQQARNAEQIHAILARSEDYFERQSHHLRRQWDTALKTMATTAGGALQEVLIGVERQSDDIFAQLELRQASLVRGHNDFFAQQSTTLQAHFETLRNSIEVHRNSVSAGMREHQGLLQSVATTAVSIQDTISTVSSELILVAKKHMDASQDSLSEAQAARQVMLQAGQMLNRSTSVAGGSGPDILHFAQLGMRMFFGVDDALDLLTARLLRLPFATQVIPVLRYTIWPLSKLAFVLTRSCFMTVARSLQWAVGLALFIAMLCTSLFRHLFGYALGARRSAMSSIRLRVGLQISDEPEQIFVLMSSVRAKTRLEDCIDVPLMREELTFKEVEPHQSSATTPQDPRQLQLFVGPAGSLTVIRSGKAL